LSGTQTGEGRLIARNAASAYAQRGLLVLSALLLTPFLYRTLGAAGFGTWSVMFTLMMISELFETGFSTGIIKLVSEHRGRGSRDEVETIVRFGFLLMGAVGVVAALAAAAVGRALDGLAAEAWRSDFRRGMLVLAVGIVIRYPCIAFLAALKGYQRWDRSNVADGLYLATFAIGAVVAVMLGYGVLGVAVAYASGMVASAFLAGLLLHRADPQLRLRPQLATRAARRRMLDTSSFALLAESMVFIGQRMDVMIIAAMRGAAAAAPFAAALKLQSGVQTLTLPFVRLLMPMTSELWARGERDEVVRRTTLATRVALQITLPVALAFALFSHDIVRLWLGASAPGVTATIIVVLMAVQVSTLTAAPAETVLIAVGRVRWVGLIGLFEGAANVALTIVLVRGHGAVGAAAATLLTSAMLAPVKYPLVCRSIGTPTWRFVRDSLGTAALASLPAVTVMIAVRATLPSGPLRLVIGLGAGVAAAVAVGAAQVGLGRIAEDLRTRRRPFEESSIAAGLAGRGLEGA
jgi:O-antigen/teichoic acid export membrane protein